MSRRERLSKADAYLRKRAELQRRPLVSDDVTGVNQVVVIPVLCEEARLFDTIASLARCSEKQLASTLVICVVNNRDEPWATAEQISDNQATLKRLEAIGSRDPGGLRLGWVDASSPGHRLSRKRGVGEARKIGLDHALAVLRSVGEDQGILFCLDADSPVAPNYLEAVRRHFEGGAWAAVIAYEHPFPANDQQRAAILAYETYLRYHELGLRRAGSPYAFATIGSTIAVRSDAYVASGGMNRRQAGEDFYFLQQLAKTGDISYIDDTCVYPSSRSSDRVPFGTGASVAHHMAASGSDLMVYDPEVYTVLGEWLSLVSRGLDSSASELLEGAKGISPQLASFLDERGFLQAWPRLQDNARDHSALEAQFHRWFDGFATLKLIHFLRDQALPSQSVFQATSTLLQGLGVSVPFAWGRLADDLDLQAELVVFLRQHLAREHRPFHSELATKN